MPDESRRPDAAETVFSGRMVGVTVERWGDAEREIVERADSVAIVAVEPDGDVVLVRQLREAARGDLLELPAGTVDEGEDPLATAKRELAEETGLHGRRWRRGPVFYTTPGFCRERVHLFFAEELERSHPARARDEAIKLVRRPLAEVAAELDALEDGKTLVGLLLALRERV
ncbi:MAG TPA: NUDIX hydrolase [Gaiellaceae bacterium]|nr:NUDIX hydrolase [Gaiellaceae bacterium]